MKGADASWKQSPAFVRSVRGEKATHIQGPAGNLSAKAVRNRGHPQALKVQRKKSFHHKSLLHDMVRKQECLHLRDLSSKMI